MNFDLATTQSIIQFLSTRLSPQVIYLFGSAASGEFRLDSDIDLAFLCDSSPTPYTLFGLAQELADIVKREVDLVDLKSASTVLCTQVIGRGKILACTNEKARAQFEMQTLKEYALLNEERAEIIQGVHERGRLYER